jgi:nicotinamidase-related amidase
MKEVIDKETFGSVSLPSLIDKDTDEIILCGLCTDICVISNAMILKASFPEIKISVDALCCAGVTEESHKTALDAMKAVQIEITE